MIHILIMTELHANELIKECWSMMRIGKTEMSNFELLCFALFESLRASLYAPGNRDKFCSPFTYSCFEKGCLTSEENLTRQC